jgi:hypothetical protein
MRFTRNTSKFAELELGSGLRQVKKKARPVIQHVTVALYCLCLDLQRPKGKKKSVDFLLKKMKSVDLYIGAVSCRTQDRRCVKNM